jgi:hypothetical protein
MRSILLILLFLASVLGQERDYAGPNAIGPFRIDQATPLQTIFAQVGAPASTKGNHFCYQSADSKRFVWVDRMAHVAGDAGDLLLSDFPNCTDRPPQETSADLAAWRADKGIGVGTTEVDVLNAYGAPSRRDEVGGRAYRWVIQGDHSPSEKRSELGTHVLVYGGAHDDLRTAEFGIRDGKVAWVFLSANE